MIKVKERQQITIRGLCSLGYATIIDKNLYVLRNDIKTETYYASRIVDGNFVDETSLGTDITKEFATDGKNLYVLQGFMGTKISKINDGKVEQIYQGVLGGPTFELKTDGKFFYLQNHRSLIALR